MGEPAQDGGQEWDEDPLTVVTTQRWARTFGAGVRVLLGVSTLALAFAVLHYASQDGSAEDPGRQRAVAALIVVAVAFGTLLVLALAAPLGRPDPGRIRRRFALVSAVAALSCLAGIVLAWMMVYQRDARYETVGSLVTGPRQAESYLRAHLPRANAGARPVPTGVFLQSVEFRGASNVGINGYVWQRVPKGSDAAPGVIFPEAGPNAHIATHDEVYRQDQGDHTLVGWYFDILVRQHFDYSSYPLDKQNVWLRMWSADFTNRTILMPDFAAYPPWDIRRMIAIDRNMVYGEWNPDFSGFSYTVIPYNSNFGYGTTATNAGNGTPELYFNLGIKRDPRAPLYGQLIRWLFIALIVFAALFLVTVEAERREVVGFTTFEIMSFAVGMLLVIVFDQVAVREAVEARGIVYLEYFSYALYAMILLVGLNAMLITARTKMRALTWGGNLLPKLLYWPGYFGIVLIATLLNFFT